MHAGLNPREILLADAVEYFRHRDALLAEEIAQGVAQQLPQPRQ
jgi:hypothetical protein